VTFAKGEPPVKGFFSLTLYDEQHFFAPNGKWTPPAVEKQK
jgi:hypothetical protein